MLRNLLFLMRFGQFAGNAKFPWAEHGMGNRERFAQSVLTFKEDKRQCQIGKGRQRLFLIRAAAGKEPQKRERLRRDAAPGERRHGRTRPRNHRYGNPRRAWDIMRTVVRKSIRMRHYIVRRDFLQNPNIGQPIII